MNKLLSLLLLFFLTLSCFGDNVLVVFYRTPDNKNLNISEVYENSTNKIKNAEFKFTDKIEFITTDKVMIYGWYVGDVYEINRLRHDIYKGRHYFGLKTLINTNMVYSL